MPMYRIKCDACGKREMMFRKVDERNDTPLCCKEPMVRLLEAPAVRGDLGGYSCPITGDWIEGRRAHEENLAKHGCRVMETGEAEGHARNRKSEDDALADAVAETAAQIAEAMPAEKKALLGQALEAPSTNDTYERS